MTLKTLDSQDSSFAQKSDDIDFRDFIRILIRRRWTLLIAFCVIFFIVAGYTFSYKPVYEALSTIHIGKNGEKMDDIAGALGLNHQNPVETEVEIITSRTNAERVVKHLHLDWRVTDKSRGMSFRILDFGTTDSDETYHVSLSDPDSYTVSNSKGQTIASGRSGRILQADNLRLLIDDVHGKQGDSFKLSIIPLHEAAAAIRGRIKATEVRKRTNVIRISFEDNNPVKARDIVNTLTRIYLEQRLANKTRAANNILDFIEQHTQTVQADLEKAEKNLQAYKSETGLILLDAKAEELLKNISETEKELVKVTLQRKQTEYALSSLRDAIEGGWIYTPAVGGGNDPAVAVIASNLAVLEVEKKALLTDLTESHPQVKAIQAKINELQTKMAAIYKTGLKNLARQENDIAKTLAEHARSLRKLPDTERELAKLTRFAKVNAELYTLLLQKREEARIAKTSTINTINIIDPAIIPIKPIKPKKLQYLLLGSLISLIISSGLAFILDYWDDTVKDAESVRRELNVPVLSVIPHISRQESEVADHRTAPIMNIKPKSAASEAFRTLRTSIHFSAINREKKIILATSTFPGEGKTTIISNLAVAMAQAGARVLLMDGDMRRSNQHKIFDCSQAPGLTECLVNDIAVETVIRNTEISGLEIITAGTTPPNPSELLGSEAMANLLVELNARYDHILIDAPPVLAVSDASVLTARCDLVIVVMETERVPVKAARDTIDLLADIQAPLAGVVVNDKSGRAQKRYGYYGRRYYGYKRDVYYSYGYGHYGSYYSNDKGPHKKRFFRRRFFQ